MTDLNNINLGNKNVHSNFKHDKKSDVKNKQVVENTQTEDMVKPADAYGRVLVSKIDNPEMIECIKDSMDKLAKHPELVAAAVKASDDAYEFLVADEVPFAYEEACCGVCDAVVEQMQ